MGRRSLKDTQKWMQDVIMRRSDGGRLERVIRSPNIPVQDGIGIYVRAYRIRLTESLKDEFPALLRAIGEDAFGAFAEGYLSAYPPDSYTLSNLGGRFPKYLEETRPADSGGWGEFITELATIERAFNEVFDGPGPEKNAPPLPDWLARASEEEFLEMRLSPSPSLRLFRFKYPVDQCISGAGGRRSSPSPKARKTLLAMNRSDYVVKLYALKERDFQILEGLMNGLSVKEAGRGAGTAGLRKLISGWLEKRFFLAALRAPGRGRS